MIPTRIQMLRERMKACGIDAYIVPSSDPHQSEYVADHYASRAFITGFTGSSGTAVITQSEAGLWTDGRYFIQAENQLKNTGITLFRMGEKGVPTLFDYLNEQLPNGATIGFDGRVISLTYYKQLTQATKGKGFAFDGDYDLIGDIWDDRPEVPTTPVILHDVKYAGKTREEKIQDVRQRMAALGATHYLLCGLDDIAWLLNIRGQDIPYNPLTIAYVVITTDSVHLFIDGRKLTDPVREALEESHITLHPYDDIERYLETVKEGRVLLDPSKTNLKLYRRIAVEVIERNDITTELKAIKNETELKNLRHVMIRDGIAMVKFIRWLKETVKARPISEIEAAERLDSLRAEDPLFVNPSFATISAYGSNAAMPHYHATPQNHSMIQPKGFYLVDSGGQYYDGTTDITRTIAVGPLTPEEKHDFTLVLKGMIQLSRQKFIYGATGSTLDVLARSAMWNEGIDFKHGTGHGVGFFLNVHEGPHRISMAPNRVKLEPGMITSNEPGIYKEGRYGIRTENLLVVQQAEANEFGQFLEFETLTLCPIDLEALEIESLTIEERRWLNDYHQYVYDKLSPYLNGADLHFLQEATRAI